MLAGGGTVVIFLSVVGGVVGWFSRTSSSALEELTEPEVTIFEKLMSQYLFLEAKHLSILFRFKGGGETQFLECCYNRCCIYFRTYYEERLTTLRRMGAGTWRLTPAQTTSTASCPTRRRSGPGLTRAGGGRVTQGGFQERKETEV